MSTSLLAHALRLLASLAGLPGPRLRRRLAEAFAAREFRRRSARALVVECNLRLAALDAALAVPTLANAALTLLESLRYWTWPRSVNLRDVVAVHGLPLLESMERDGAVIIIAPHYGNWELLVQWFAHRRRLTLIYSRGKSAVIDRFLKRVRERSGVCAVPADMHGMKPLLRALQRGETVGFTPDQRPDDGGGLWSPFFGVPALTMTLPHRLGERVPQARQVLAFAERRADGRFEVHLWPVPAAVTSGPVQDGVDALNVAIETVVRRDPSQYQWTYKRFRGQRPGEDAVNPYWPECYRCPKR